LVKSTHVLKELTHDSDSHCRFYPTVGAGAELLDGAKFDDAAREAGVGPSRPIELIHVCPPGFPAADRLCVKLMTGFTSTSIVTTYTRSVTGV
jgi:hypothetical protein